MAEENWKKRSRIILDNALSRLGGVDVGKYPEHHFLRDSSQPPLEGWPLRIEFAGEDVWVAGCYRFRERSDTFSVEFVLEGRFRFRQNGEEFIAGPGDLFLVQPGRNSEIICDLDASKLFFFIYNMKGIVFILRHRLTSFGPSLLERHSSSGRAHTDIA